jgi:hypothetical protein
MSNSVVPGIPGTSRDVHSTNLLKKRNFLGLGNPKCMTMFPWARHWPVVSHMNPLYAYTTCMSKPQWPKIFFPFTSSFPTSYLGLRFSDKTLDIIRMFPIRATFPGQVIPFLCSHINNSIWTVQNVTLFARLLCPVQVILSSEPSLLFFFLILPQFHESLLLFFSVKNINVFPLIAFTY